MSQTISPAVPTASAPKVGFVSASDAQKPLVDSEQIITQLRAEGYEISGSYDGADLVVVNTCGFIDEAVQESLDAIGEALHENGKVIVTGCLGAKKSASGTGLDPGSASESPGRDRAARDRRSHESRAPAFAQAA
jgi:ribosomal protein S12 methylthiotransferase